MQSDRPIIHDASSSGASKKRKFSVDELDEKTGERLQGICIKRNKLGMTRYAAEIRDPITHKMIRIGVFDTIQQASKAYKGKEKELFESNFGDEIGEFDIRFRVFGENSGERITGVWRTKTCNQYDTKIRDPYTRLDIWVGTYDTIQQASEAYNAKKRELETETLKLKYRQLGKVGKLERVFDEKEGKRIDGVWKWTIGQRYITKIQHPATKKYLCLGSFDTYQKASEVYQAKKKELQATRMHKAVKEFEWVGTERVCDTTV